MVTIFALSMSLLEKPIPVILNEKDKKGLMLYIFAMGIYEMCGFLPRSN